MVACSSEKFRHGVCVAVHVEVPVVDNYGVIQFLQRVLLTSVPAEDLGKSERVIEQSGAAEKDLTANSQNPLIPIALSMFHLVTGAVDNGDLYDVSALKEIAEELFGLTGRDEIQHFVDDRTGRLALLTDKLGMVAEQLRSAADAERIPSITLIKLYGNHLFSLTLTETEWEQVQEVLKQQNRDYRLINPRDLEQYATSGELLLRVIALPIISYLAKVEK